MGNVQSNKNESMMKYFTYVDDEIMRETKKNR